MNLGSNKSSKSLNCHQKRKGKRKKKSALDHSEENMKTLKLRPNYFFGFQVYNPAIHRKVRDLQERIIKEEPSLYDKLIKIPTLHITLAVTHLANYEEVRIVSNKLKDWSNENVRSFFKEPITLTFSGVKTFTNKVAFVNISHDKNYDRLCLLAAEMTQLLQSLGFENESGREYHPHLTFLKLSKGYELPKCNYAPVFDKLRRCDDYFGQQEISHIQLLSMLEKKDEKGYYKCCAQINTRESKQEEFDHTICCCSIEKPVEKLQEHYSHLREIRNRTRRNIHTLAANALKPAPSVPDRSFDLPHIIFYVLTAMLIADLARKMVQR